MSDTPRMDAAAGLPTPDWEKVAERVFEEGCKLERELAQARTSLFNTYNAAVAAGQNEFDSRAHALGLQSNVEKLRAALEAITRRVPIMASTGDYREGQLHALEACSEVAREVLAATVEVTPESTWTPDVIAVGDPIQPYVPSRQQLLVWIRERAKRDDTGLSIMEAYHAALDRAEEAERDLVEIDAYVKAIWRANALPSPMPPTLRDRLGAQPMFPGNGRSNGGVRCDSDDGPCACGAWHKREDHQP